jgi:hypothetical protein
MAKHVRELSSQVVTCLAILVSCLMATILIKAPHSFLTYLFIATPFLFLFGVWNSYRSLAGAMDSMKVGQLKVGDGPAASSLLEWSGVMAAFGLCGTGVALAMGFLLGHMSVR